MKSTRTLILSVTLLNLFFRVLMTHAAEGDMLWTRTYDNRGEEYAYAMIQTADGGFLLAGSTNRSGAGDVDAWLVNASVAGDSLWSRLYGGPDIDVAFAVVPAEDGYVFAGYTYSYGAGASDMWLFKTDLNGDSLWSKTYGGNSLECAYAVTSTTDGGYLLAGETWSFGGGGASNIWIVKTDEFGDSLWSKTYAWSGPDVAYDVIQTQDGGFLIVGEKYSMAVGGQAAFIIKTDAQGDSLWTAIYPGTGFHSAHAVIETTEGDYLVAGDVYDPGIPAEGSFLWQTDGSGNLIWSNTYSGSDVYSVIQTQYDHYVIAGSIQSGMDAWMVKTTETGDSLWSMTSGLLGFDAAADLLQTDDGNYYLAGSQEDPGLAGPNFLLLCLTGEKMELQLSADSLDYGLVEVGARDSLPLCLYNTGSEVIEINAIFSSHPVFYTSYTTADSLIEPGDSLNLNVYFYPDSDTLYAEFLTIESNAETTNVALLGESEATGVMLSHNPPSGFEVLPPHPNPFNAATVIRYQIPDARYVSLRVYDTAGRRVETLVDGWREAGEHEVTFNALGLPSGLYLYRLAAGEYHAMGKVALLK